MFEGSLVESRSLVVSPTQRWTAFGSLALQCSLAALLIIIPLLRPQSLPFIIAAPKLVAPVPPPRPPIPMAQPQPASSSSQAVSVPAPTTASAAQHLFPHPAAQPTGDAPRALPILRMGPGNSPIPIGLGPMPTQPAVSVIPSRPAGRVPLSSGVVAGLLLTPIQPIYPPIAKAAGVQGTVVVEAIISRAGRIESLHTISGPPMLRAAALDAISAARYRPYMLDGEPTEVQTTITVVFRLGP
jgi:protein TonB